MDEPEIRLLKPSEIEVRISRIAPNGVALLLYKTARTDRNILTETFGKFGWQNKYYSVNDSMICSVGIKYDNEWIWKDNCGDESNIEKKKGEASDAFKRACFNWGIGEELYSAPDIFVYANKCEIKGNKCYDRFTVEEIEYDKNRKICKLVIANRGRYGDKYEIVYSHEKDVPQKQNEMPSRQAPQQRQAPPPSKQIPPSDARNCPMCGKMFEGQEGNDGKFYSAEYILKRYKVCPTCYKKTRSQKKAG